MEALTTNPIFILLAVLFSWVILVRLVGWWFLPHDTEEEKTNSLFKMAGIVLFPPAVLLIILGVAHKKLDEIAQDNMLPVDTDDDEKYLP